MEKRKMFNDSLRKIIKNNGRGGPGIIKSNFNPSQKKQLSNLGVKFSSGIGKDAVRAIVKSGKKRKSLGFSPKSGLGKKKKAKVKNLVLKNRITGKVTKLPSLKKRKPVFS